MTTTTAPSAPEGRVEIEKFGLLDNDGHGVDFELDMDLYGKIKRAVGDSGSCAGVVLVELGIDGHPAHRVSVDHFPIMAGPGEDPADYVDAWNLPRRDNGVGGGYRGHRGAEGRPRAAAAVRGREGMRRPAPRRSSASSPNRQRAPRRQEGRS